MRDIHLHGALGKEFGALIRLEVDSIAETIQALMANFPKFSNAIRHGFYRVVVGRTANSGLPLGESELHGFKLGRSALHIVPLPRGRKRGGLGKIVAGIALIGLSLVPGFAPVMAASLWSGSATIGSMIGTMGSSLILTGVASLIAPEQNSGDTKESFTMSGPTSELREGGIIPIVYGEVITGGYMISGGVQINTEKDEGGTTTKPLGGALRDLIGGSVANPIPAGGSTPTAA